MRITTASGARQIAVAGEVYKITVTDGIGFSPFDRIWVSAHRNHRKLIQDMFSIFQLGRTEWVAREKVCNRIRKPPTKRNNVAIEMLRRIHLRIATYPPTNLLTHILQIRVYA